MPKPAAVRDTSIRSCRAKRDFTVTAESAPGAPKPSSEARLFVVQKRAARRAGLHRDLRLEHGGGQCLEHGSAPVRAYHPEACLTRSVLKRITTVGKGSPAVLQDRGCGPH
jgi:hypothetical protein